jgi:hypothetical protein
MDQSLSTISIISNEHSIFVKNPELKKSIVDALKELHDGLPNWKHIGTSTGSDFNEKDFQIVPMLPPNMPKFLNHLEKEKFTFSQLSQIFKDCGQYEIARQIDNLMIKSSSINSTVNVVTTKSNHIKNLSKYTRGEPYDSNKIYINCLLPGNNKLMIDDNTKEDLLLVFYDKYTKFNEPVWRYIARNYLGNDFHDIHYKEREEFNLTLCITTLAQFRYTLAHFKNDLYKMGFNELAGRIPDT